MRRTLLTLVLALALVAPLVPTALAAGDDEEPQRGPRSPTGQEGSQPEQEAQPEESHSSDDEPAGSDDSDDRPARNDGGNSAGGQGAAPASEGQGRGRGGDDLDDDGGDVDDPREDKGAPFGSFHVRASSREVTGDYVAFDYDDSRIGNFSVGGTTLFDADVEDGGRDERVKGTVARGSQVRVEMPGYELKSHDNPGAVTRIDAREGALTLRFATSAVLTLLDDARVRFQVGNLTGVVRGDSLTVENGSVRANEDVLVMLDAPRGRFDVHREALTDAIAKRHIGAELSLQKRDGTLEEDSISYGNVTLTPIKAEPGNLTVLIDGHGFDGRVIVLNVDGDIIGASTPEELRVLFDNASISRASNLSDVLDPDDDGLMAEYYPVFDPATQTFQLIVSVPHYSVHTLSIGTFVVPVQPSVVVGLLAGVFLLVPSGWVLFRRK